MISFLSTRPRHYFLPGLAGMILLAAWFGGISWATDAGIRKFEAHTVADPTQPSAPQPWRQQRFFAEPDSYNWLSYTRDLLSSGHFRVRHTVADNAPFGREVHWSQLPIWCLAGMTRLLESCDISSPVALELAGRLLMPLFGWLFFSALYLLLGPRLGWRLTLLAIAAMTVSLQWEFHPLRPDHHGFQLAAAILAWLALLLGGMGRIQKTSASQEADGPPPLATARRWFVLSGLFGGIGLWLGATVFLFSLAIMAAGAVAVLLFIPPPGSKNPDELSPGLWRLWGLAGAITSLLLYAVEYAPHHLSMRLEANHPLYALCWLGTAECLRALTVWRTRGRLSTPDLLLTAAGFFSAALLPLLILAGPTRWFLPRTGIMLRLHAHHILEFHTLFSTAGNQWPKTYLLSSGVVFPAILWTAVLLLRQRLPVTRQLVLLPLWVGTVMFTLLYFWQIRWEPFALAAGLLLAVFLLADRFSDARTNPRLSRGLPWILTLLFTAQLVYGAIRITLPLRQLLRVEKMDELWLKALLQRNLMLQLKTESGNAPLRLALPAEMAPAVYYFGVGDAIGSLYWENTDGLTALTGFFGNPLPGREARQIARERGITHVLMNNGAGDALMFYQLETGRSDQLGASRTIGGATAQSGTPVPSWLHPVSGLASPCCYTFVPAIHQWVPLSLPVSLYQAEP